MKFLIHLLKPIVRFLNGLRRFIVNLFFFAALALLVLFFAAGDETIHIDNNTLLVLDIHGVVVEQVAYVSPVDQLTGQALGFQSQPQESYLYDILAAIDRAQHDERISGIHLKLDYFTGAGLSKLQQISERLIRFREQTNKPVIATGDYFTQNQYYLAAHADRVLLHSEGAVELQGFHSYQNYFASFFEKLKIRPHIFKAGDYKTATEPYTHDAMSDEARQQGALWLNDLWAQYIHDIANQRVLHEQILSGRITDYLYALESADYNEAQLAQQTGLVDVVLSRPDMHQALIEASGLETDNNSYNAIPYLTYLRSFGPAEQHDGEPAIQVIVASGTLVDGYSAVNTIAGDSLAATLRDARLDESIQGVVLRIDSPGGSAFAAEVIREEMVLFKAAGKPIYASLSSTAASGGYWIALGADKIFAAPSTITGSIGVFGLFFSIEESFNQLGINFDGISTTEMPFIDSGKTLDPAAALMIQHSVDRTYRRFLELVAAHRQIPIQQLSSIASGRVWTGQQAAELGLVDGLASLADVVERLSNDHQIDDYFLKMPQPHKGSLDSFVEGFLQVKGALTQRLVTFGLTQPANVRSVAKAPAPSVSQQFIQRQLKQLSAIDEFNDPRGLYSRCTECREVF